MNNIKETVKSMINNLPDDASLDDIMEHLYVKQKIIKAQEQMESGHFYSHTEARELMEKWLKYTH
jgi:hypothetical protein